MTSSHGTSGYMGSMTYDKYVVLTLAGISPLKAFVTWVGYSPSRAISGYPATITAPDFTQTLVYSDGMNRLTRALYTETGRTADPFGLVKVEGTASYTESVAYDLWSNPVRIRRHGITEVPASTSRGTLRFGLCDDITLTYSGDRLVRADDAAADCRFSGAMDFTDGASKSAEYTYDAAGNMLTDANKGIDAVTYNCLHRPESVQTGGDTFGFVYDAAGNLLQRTHYHPMGTLNPLGGLMQLTSGLDPGAPTLQSMTDTVSYCGPFEYSGGSLSRVNFPGGYVSGGVAYHYIHDHQGNVRQVVDATTGKVVQENHYYPGGMLFAESTATYFKPGSADNSYRYGGKELLTADGLNLSLHGARMYEPALLRFITPDPLRHETPYLSSYLYCAANPVMLVDLTGEKPSPYEAALMAAAVYKDKKEYDRLIGDLSERNWVISSFDTSIKKNHSAGTGIGMQSMLFERDTDEGKEYAYVYAGTNSWEDCVEDLTQLAGITQQYPAAIRNAKTLSSELGETELTFVGHSMGGGQAAAASMATGRDAITFNAAAVSFMTKLFNGLYNKRTDKIENYVSATPKKWIVQRVMDPITYYQSRINLNADGKRILVPVGYFWSHGIMDIVNALKPDK